MRWLREHGLISDWWQFDELPAGVLLDALLLMQSEADAARIRNGY